MMTIDEISKEKKAIEIKIYEILRESKLISQEGIEITGISVISVEGFMDNAVKIVSINLL